MVQDDNKELSSRSTEEKWADWLQAVGSIVTSLILIVLTIQQMKSAEDHQKHEVMSDYVKQMTELRIEHGLSPLFLTATVQDPKEKEKREQVIAAAQDNTLNAARQLDGERRGQLLKFLYDAKLIGGCPDPNPHTGKIDVKQCHKGIVPFKGIKLEEATPDPDFPLSLAGVNLSGAFLSDAKLRNIVLKNADLSGAELENADMTGASLDGATMSRTRLNGAFLSKAKMPGANLVGAILRKATLSDTSFEGADLRCADLIGAKLQNTNLKGAIYSHKTKFPANFDVSKQEMRKFNPRDKDSECKSDLEPEIIQAALE